MATDVQIALQPQAGVDPAAAQLAAAVRQVRASLALLSQQVGQSLVGTVVEAPDLPSGFSQISTTLAHTILRLERPIPAGSRVQISVQPGPSPTAPPLVTVTPLASERPVAPAPQAAQPLQVPAPVAFSAPAPLLKMPPGAASRPIAPGNPPAPIQSASVTNLPIITMTSNAAEPMGKTLPTVSPSPISAPPPPASQQTTQAFVAPVISATAPATSPPPAALGSPPSVGNPSMISTPSPPAETIAKALPAVVSNPMPASSPQPPQTPAQAFVPPAISPSGPAASPSLATRIPPPGVASTPVASTPSPAAEPTAKALPTAVPSTVPASPPPPQTLRSPTQAFVPPAISPPGPAASPPPAALVQVQQSPGPLLETLVRQFPHLPPAVAQAASQLLAQRLPLDRGPPTAAALKTAVLQSGVLLDLPTRGAGMPDVRTALIQLRSALLNWAGGSVDPVAPVGRRPPPPMRGAPPRAPLPPTLAPDGDGSPRDTIRHLLAQTEGALARLKLLQYTSQGNDQRQGATTTPAEWNLELPLLVGRELAMMQVQVGRDAREQKSGRAPSWRLRFALRLSAIGEVGAHVALTGHRTSVALWAEDPDTASVLEDMLPDLSKALGDRGLEVGALSIRRGAPQTAASAPGNLMDAST